MKIVVLDYGFGNVRSAVRALEECVRRLQLDASVELSGDVALAEAADFLLIPGVGAFGACMEALNSLGVKRLIQTRIEEGRPTLGICVGFQVMFEGGTEGIAPSEPPTLGLGFLPGLVQKLDATVLPHMGWNSIGGEELLYFVHSFGVASELTGSMDPGTSPGKSETTTKYQGHEFISAFETSDHLLAGTQFHPEKSGEAGLKLLERWLQGISIA